MSSPSRAFRNSDLVQSKLRIRDAQRYNMPLPLSVYGSWCLEAQLPTRLSKLAKSFSLSTERIAHIAPQIISPISCSALKVLSLLRFMRPFCDCLIYYGAAAPFSGRF